MEQDRALRVLEFTKIRERLAAHALTDMGKEKCLALVPYDDVSEVRRALDETEEACVLLSYLGGQPLVAFPDVREQVTLAQKGACLSPRRCWTWPPACAPRAQPGPRWYVTARIRPF